jgi:hypothetical protein
LIALVVALFHCAILALNDGVQFYVGHDVYSLVREIRMVYHKCNICLTDLEL